MKWDATKYFLPSVIGLFFGYVASIFIEWRKSVPYFDYQKFIESLWIIFPFIGTVLAITVFTDITAFGWEKTKKNVPSKLLAIKSWIQKERRGNFEKKLIIEENGIFLNIKPEKRFPFSSKITIVADYKEKRNFTLSKKDFKSKLDYEVARMSNLTNLIVHNPLPKSLDVVSNIKSSKGQNHIFEIFTFDKEEDIFWVHGGIEKPEVFWNNDEFRELEYMSFGFGKHEFQLSTKNTGFFGINFNEKYSFIVDYDASGFSLQS